jgi:hypothetical protein
MVSFYDMWLRIDELTSMSQIDSSGVELEKRDYPRGYTYEFDQIKVLLNRRHAKQVGDKMVDGIWSVMFSKNNSYELTGDSGSGGTAVYGKILAAIKKLTEIEEVNGLYFSGAESRQDIMYDRFLKTLGGFTPVGGDVYLRDEIVKANASEENLDHYKRAGERRESKLHNLKVVKAALRNKGLTGKITGYSDSDSGKVLPAIVMEIDVSLDLTLLVWDGYSAKRKYITSGELEYSTSPSSIDPSLISSLMDEIQKDDSMLSKYLKRSGLSVDGSTYDFGFKKVGA